MSFNPAIPNKPDFLAISQMQLKANFNAINTAFARNHIALGQADQGMHNSLLFRAQALDPTTIGGQGCLYNKLTGPNSIPQIYFRSNNDQTPVQLTNSNYSVSLNEGVQYSLSTFVAGAFTVYTGYVINATQNQLITLTPSTTLIYVGLGTSITQEVSGIVPKTAVATNVSVNSFNIRYPLTMILDPAPAKRPIIYYLAVGI